MIKRTELHQRFGGSGRGGISPSSLSSNVFVFTNPESGEIHGYLDSWKDDGCFHYTGEGQRGDQEMVRGNRAILDAARSGRALRVFKASSTTVEYQGRFELDPHAPYYEADAPETAGGPVRKVIVFRLRPVDASPQPATGLPAVSSSTAVANVPVEEHNTEKSFVEPDREPYTAERRESELVQRFKHFAEARGHTVHRLKITPAGEAKPLFTDLYLKDADTLIEAKGTTDRIAIRMAIGQLTDYRRFLASKVRCAVLLPALPRKDLRLLLAYAGIAIYYPNESDFALLAPEALHTSS